MFVKLLGRCEIFFRNSEESISSNKAGVAATDSASAFAVRLAKASIWTSVCFGTVTENKPVDSKEEEEEDEGEEAEEDPSPPILVERIRSSNRSQNTDWVSSRKTII